MTGPTTLRRDAADNRRRLIAAAVDTFNDTGIDASVEEIAHRAGVGVGTVYRRFPNKEALIAFLVDQMMDEMIASAVEARTVAGGGGLEQFLREIADQLAGHRGCLQRLWKHTTTDTTRLDELRAHIDRLVEDAHDTGTIRSDVTRADITAVIWSMQGVIDNAGDDAHAACARLVTVMFAGLAS